jgi:uncharacterized membrane protein YqhA
MNKALASTRYLVLIAVAGLLITSIATFGAAGAKSIEFVGNVFDGQWRKDTMILDLLKVIDTYLLAVVQLIVVVGLYELFIGAVSVPEWLRVDSLDDLKKAIIDVLVVFIAVKGIEGLLSKSDPLDVLAYVGASGLLILVLTAFRIAKVAGKK